MKFKNLFFLLKFPSWLPYSSKKWQRFSCLIFSQIKKIESSFAGGKPHVTFLSILFVFVSRWKGWKQSNVRFHRQQTSCITETCHNFLFSSSAGQNCFAVYLFYSERHRHKRRMTENNLLFLLIDILLGGVNCVMKMTFFYSDVPRKMRGMLFRELGLDHKQTICLDVDTI